MDQSQTPVLEAIDRYRREDNYAFALPGRRLGLGIDDRTAAVLTRSAFEADVITAKHRHRTRSASLETFRVVRQ
jgi:arginine decarboxylase